MIVDTRMLIFCLSILTAWFLGYETGKYILWRKMSVFLKSLSNEIKNVTKKNGIGDNNNEA